MADKKSSKLGLGIVVGAAVGAVAGLFLAPKAGKELRDDAKNIYNKLKDKQPDEIVQEIFGKVSEESRGIYDHAKMQLAHELSNLKENYQTIDKNKYLKVVGNVLKHVKEERDVPEKELKALGKHLGEDFKKLFPATKGLVKKVAPKKKKTAPKKNPTKKLLAKK